jgi:CRP-like cAMP-binding protein
MIVVLQGSVKIVSLSPTGKEVVVHAGAVLGELAVITGEERSVDAAAMTDCELLIIDRRDVLPMFERHFEICIMLMQILCRRLRETGEQVEDVLFRSRGLEARVAEQVEELGRVGRLKRFLPPQLAELVVSQGDEKILESHRREIVVVFCDLRGYTAFTETAEPEDQFEFLRQYLGAWAGIAASATEGPLWVEVARSAARPGRSAIPRTGAIRQAAERSGLFRRRSCCRSRPWQTTRPLRTRNRSDRTRLARA